MKRTISVMLGKGSISHNSRKFAATNIDSERSQYNTVYCDTPIKEVYHQLFDDAVKRYNEKQTRSDRTISDYYEKIRTSKQEKLFYEVILQVGNKDNMSATSKDGQLAAEVLDTYMRDFQERNPNLKVFSAHLHMDEATPHLHIDFVPFTTGSKRGLDTRVSLKQALAKQGFHGGTRGATEWNQWVKSEKEQLSQVMERNGIEWEKLGTHDEHLSVVDYKKVQRSKEVAELDDTITKKSKEVDIITERKVVAKNKLDDVEAKVGEAENKLSSVRNTAKLVRDNARQYDDDPQYELPKPKPLMSAKTYYETVAFPLVRKLKNVIRSILLQFAEKTRDLNNALSRANGQIANLSARLSKLEPEHKRLQSVERDYDRVRRVLGDERVNVALRTAKVQELEISERKPRRSKELVR
ncbi:MAG: plasmid recombination protein [Oscillospiraceae bacterium]|nr:plasmid recombination protein [Oscillospiraceae bacterium]